MILNAPFFSVIIPTYNRPALLSRAIDSVLSSSYKDVEILVVNDGSTLVYPDPRERYGDKVRYYESSTSCGAAASRNTGVAMAKGEWIVFLDDDDELVPEYLWKVKDTIRSYESCSAVWTGARVIQKAGARIEIMERTFPESYSSTKYLIKDLLSIGLGFGFAIDRNVFNYIGRFDDKFSVGEDTELFFRLISKGYIPRPMPGVGVVKHEEHDNRLSSDYAIYSRENIYNKIFDKHKNGFCKKWRYNYIHMLMWSYRLHRNYGNEDSQGNDFDALVRLGIPKDHIDECYVTGSDLSADYVK
jgi:glycosyltransferase involved in cell wall biosynthesis